MEINGEVHEFFVVEKSHPRYTKIEAVWKDITWMLRLAWYKADTTPVMFDIDEEEKEDAFCLHSEKAAIAFGIMSLREDGPIRIVKNLRVCGDCHQVSMMISKIFDREIIVIDRNRFHHFKDGHCSCNGFWPTTKNFAYSHGIVTDAPWLKLLCHEITTAQLQPS